MEGYLPPIWCAVWYAIALPVVAYGIYRLIKITDENPESKPLIAMAGAFMFVLSSLKMPSVTGSCSHPTGNALGAVLFGPAIASVLAFITLIFQALLMAHGGLSTLGANTVSMGIVGTVAAWIVWKICEKVNISHSVGIFLAAVAGDWLTYVTTSIQLALAFPIPNVASAALKFMAIYAYTQVPLAIAEGLLTMVVFREIIKKRPDILENLKVVVAPKTTESEGE